MFKINEYRKKKILCNYLVALIITAIMMMPISIEFIEADNACKTLLLSIVLYGVNYIFIKKVTNKTHWLNQIIRLKERKPQILLAIALISALVLTSLFSTNKINEIKGNSEPKPFKITIYDNIYTYNDVWINKLEIDNYVVGIESLGNTEGWTTNGYGTFWTSQIEGTQKELVYEPGIKNSFVIGLATGPASGLIKISYSDREEVVDCKTSEYGIMTIQRQLLRPIDVLAYMCMIFISLAYMIYLILANIVYGYNNIKYRPLYFSILPTSIFVMCQLIYYPGFMSADSFNQWNQATTLNMTNAHPVISTLYLVICQRIFNNPGFVILVQLFLVAGVIGWSCSIIEKIFAKRKIVIGLNLFMALYPIFSLYSITMWKDIIYSLLLLIATNLLLLLLHNEEWLNHKKNYFMLTGTIILIYLYRHNGIVPAIIILISLLIILKGFRKKIFLMISIVLVSTSLFNGLVVRSITTEENGGSVVANTILGSMGAVISSDYEIEDEEFWYKVLPEEEWKSKYNPYTLDPLGWNPLLDKELLNSKMAFNSWMKHVMKYPMRMIKHQLDFNSLTLQVIQPKEGYMYVNNFRVLRNDLGIESSTKFPALTKLIDPMIDIYQRRSINWLFFRPASWMYSVLGIFLIHLLKFKTKDKWRQLLVLAPMFGNIVSILIGIVAQDVRYLFANFLIAPVLIGYFICYIQTSSSKIKSENNRR